MLTFSLEIFLFLFYKNEFSLLKAGINFLEMQAFLDFRCLVIERRARHKLTLALERKHIVEVCLKNSNVTKFP